MHVYLCIKTIDYFTRNKKTCADNSRDINIEFVWSHGCYKSICC